MMCCASLTLTQNDANSQNAAVPDKASKKAVLLMFSPPPLNGGKLDPSPEPAKGEMFAMSFSPPGRPGMPRRAPSQEIPEDYLHASAATPSARADQSRTPFADSHVVGGGGSSSASAAERTAGAAAMVGAIAGVGTGSPDEQVESGLESSGSGGGSIAIALHKEAQRSHLEV